MVTILHIEDHRPNQVLIERILYSHGHDVIHAPDGETGIQAAIDHIPDLILIDMGLPDMDGQTVVTLLKQLSFLNHTPIVAITAWPAEKAFEIADRYELAGCILKPIDVKTFPGIIDQYLLGDQTDSEQSVVNSEQSAVNGERSAVNGER